MDDRHRARKRLPALLLRHSRVYRAGSYWTGKHLQWLTRDAAVAAIDADLRVWFDREPFADAVARLGAYRGAAHLAAVKNSKSSSPPRSPASSPASCGPKMTSDDT